MKKLYNWFINSGHYKHFSFCAIIALICGFCPAMITGIAIEYKDKAWGGQFDWSDVLADTLGSIVGVSIRFIIINDLLRILC